MRLIVVASLIANQAMAMQVASQADEIAVLHDLLPGFNGPGGHSCFDPIVARDPARITRGGPERWPASTIVELLNDPRIAVDTTAGTAPTGVLGCARSRTTWRLAYGHPRIAGDTGSVVFIATRLDGRDQVDSMLFDLRLGRSKGKWGVPGWHSHLDVIHKYIRGEGCYRFTHPPFPSFKYLRIDTVLVRAETATVAAWGDSSKHVLLPVSEGVGMSPSTDRFPSHWTVTHDTLHLVWNASGFALLKVDLHVQGDSLDGVMSFSTDNIGVPIPKVAVAGNRVSCPR